MVNLQAPSAGRHGGAAAKVWRDLLVLALASAPLLCIAFLNGFPLVFSDSGSYLRTGTELYFPLDRPAVYGLAIAPFHWLGGLWTVAVAQALFTSFVINRTLSVALGSRVPPLHLLAVTSLLCVTSLPWFVGQIMPDLFTGLLPLAMFVLMWGATTMKPAERIVWAALVVGSVAFHLTHLVIALGIWIILLLCGWALGLLRRNAVGAILALASIIVAVLGMSSLNLVGAGQFKPSLMSGTFTFARLLDDRLAQPVLAEACARDKLLLCAAMPLVTRADIGPPGQAYLWNDASPRERLNRIGAGRVADEERMIVRQTLASRPGAVVKLALSGWGRQLIRARSGDGMVAYGDDMQIARQIHRHFPASAPAWMLSRQQHGELQRLAVPPALGIAAVALVVLSLLLLSPAGTPNVIALSAAIAGTLVINAAVCGILSGVVDRYQSRVIWLLTFVAIVAALAWARSRREAGTAGLPGLGGKDPLM